jgi:hypothetical protein
MGRRRTAPDPPNSLGEPAGVHTHLARAVEAYAALRTPSDAATAAPASDGSTTTAPRTT